MKYIIVKKSNMSVSQVLTEEPNFFGFSSMIKKMIHIFEEDNSTNVSVGDTCTVNQNGSRSYS